MLVPSFHSYEPFIPPFVWRRVIVYRTFLHRRKRRPSGRQVTVGRFSNGHASMGNGRSYHSAGGRLGTSRFVIIAYRTGRRAGLRCLLPVVSRIAYRAGQRTGLWRLSASCYVLSHFGRVSSPCIPVSSTLLQSMCTITPSRIEWGEGLVSGACLRSSHMLSHFGRVSSSCVRIYYNLLQSMCMITSANTLALSAA